MWAGFPGRGPGPVNAERGRSESFAPAPSS